jgi:hypothetical protein
VINKLICFLLIFIDFSLHSQLCEASLFGYSYTTKNYDYAYTPPWYSFANNAIITNKEQNFESHSLNFDKWGISFIGVTIMRAPGTAWTPFYFGDSKKNTDNARGKEKGFYIGDWLAFGFGMGSYSSSSTYKSFDKTISYSEVTEPYLSGILDLGIISGYRFALDKTVGIRWYLSIGGKGMEQLVGPRLDFFGRYKKFGGRIGYGYKDSTNPYNNFKGKREVELSLYVLEVLRKGWSINLKYNKIYNIRDLSTNATTGILDGPVYSLNAFSIGLGFVLM